MASTLAKSVVFISKKTSAQVVAPLSSTLKLPAIELRDRVNPGDVLFLWWALEDT